MKIKQRIVNGLTLRRVFPVALLIMLFSLAVLQATDIDPDLWWHLQTGHDIVSTRSIPATDIYSFTKAGSEWVTHEWLSEVLMYGIYRLIGWGGLIAVFSALIVAALAFCYKRCEGKPYVAALATLLAAAASSPTFGMRPQMLTFLLASIYLVILDRYVREGLARGLWILPPLMLLWVNLHAGFALGLALIALYIVGLVLDKSWNRIKPLTYAALACIALVPLNPNGFRMFLYPYETLKSRAMAALIHEWASPDFHQTMFLPLAALLLATLGVLAISPIRSRFGELFLLLITGFGALRSARHIPIFALVAAPVFAKHLWNLLISRGWDKKFTAAEAPVAGASLVFSVLFLLAPSVFGAVNVWHFVAHRQTYEAKNYPVAAVDFLSAQRLPAPIYNKYAWGGYLIRRLYPEYRVYIDGRADVYGDAFMIETLKTYDGDTKWREPLDRLAVRTVLIDPNVPLASLLRADQGWQRVYEDDLAVIFTREPAVQTASGADKSIPLELRSHDDDTTKTRAAP
jgi:hypothetical protein